MTAPPPDAAPRPEPARDRPAHPSAESLLIVAITRHGAAQAARLARLRPDAAVWVAARFADAFEGLPNAVTPAREPLAAAMGALMAGHGALVCFVSIGAVVRLVAPHLRGKALDPAVVVIDEAGRHVIPVLSGHLGGANALALELADQLGATPVLTTASDVAGTVAVDLLGQALGWQPEAAHAALVRAAAAVVNDEPVLVVEEEKDEPATPPAWWRADRPLPANLQRADGLAEAEAATARWGAVLWARRTGPGPALRAALGDRLVVYRLPGRPALALGLGCDRGTPAATLHAVVQAALDEAGAAWADITQVGSISLKADEAGLLALCAAQGWTPQFHPPEALAAVPVPQPSETVRRHTGTPSVSEAAALLGAGSAPGHSAPMSALRVEKQRLRGPDGRHATASLACCAGAPTTFIP